MKRIKGKLNELPKKTMALLMTFAMLVNYFLPITTVFAAAPADTSTYGVISINGSTALENKDNSNEVIATYEHGSLRISGAGLYSDGNNTVYGAGNVTIDCTADANYTCELWQNGTNSNGSTISLNNIVPNQVINIDATFNATQNQNPGNDPQQNTNTEAAMTVSAGAGSYQIRGNNVNYDDEVTGVKELKFNYNSEILELVSQKINDNRFMDAGSDNSGLYLYTTSAESIKSTDIYLLTFKVKDSATVNSNVEISTSDFYIYNNQGDPVKVDGIKTSVKVTEKQQEEQGEKEEQGGQQGEQEKQEEQENKDETKTDDGKKEETKPDAGKTEKETTNTKELTQSKEETTAKKELPKTGIGFGIGIGVGIVSIIAGVCLIKYNKYKKI